MIGDSTDVAEVAEEVRPMVLSKLLAGVAVSKLFQTMYGRMVITHDIEVNRLQYDSRKISRGDVFIAIRGTATDGKRFIQEAITRGARAVVVDDDSVVPDSLLMHAGVAKIVVPDARIALAQMSANYFNHPAKNLMLIGVTGTNGKTTTTHVIKSILDHAGQRTGMIGTIEYAIGNRIIPASHTTPESLEMNDLLAQMVANDCTSAVMEVSSHALHQHRVEGLKYEAAVFTNLTQDHLDYHGTMEEYFKTKSLLFEQLPSTSWAVINVDQDWGRALVHKTNARKITYGLTGEADVLAQRFSLSITGTEMTVLHGCEETEVRTPLIGRFNVSNVLAAFATGISLGIPKSTLQAAIRSVAAVPGRFEPITSPTGWTAVIDYAHTPDALEKVLQTIRDVFRSSETRGRIITVFGCGGDRDRSKRPRMARIATELSDVTVVTSDNPRSEDPEAIIDEILTGVVPDVEVRREVDRARAIALALRMARPGDVILIAGKGHEEYQVVGGQKYPFSDRTTVEAFLRSGS